VRDPGHLPGLTSNVPSKSLLSVRGMEGRVNSNLNGGACVRLKARIQFVLSILMQCAAERKYCAGVLGQLRGRAAAHLRGNIVDQWLIRPWLYTSLSAIV